MALSRDASQRLAEAAARYREAFQRVQDLLLDLDLGRVPSWVFAIDRHGLDAVHDFSAELHEAEVHRRRCRQALHSLAELIALDEPGQALPAAAADADDLSQLDTADDADLARLDRFISVMNNARAGGAVYLNGTFEPVSGAPETDDKATFELAPERTDAPEPGDP